MVPSASIPAVRQNRSKLTETASQALSTVPIPVGGKAVNAVIAFFMALLSFRGISTPSLPAQGEPRRSSYFNLPRGNSPGGHGKRRRVADGFRHCLASAARTPSARAAGGDRRDARLHGAGTNRQDEPLGGLPQRSLCSGRHLLRDVDGGATVHRCRSDGVGALPYRAATGPAQ